MDERYDLVRSLRDQQYVYIRNYNPHEIYGQYLSYMFQTPTTRIWKQMYDLGELNEAQSHFWQQKPPKNSTTCRLTRMKFTTSPTVKSIRRY